jgi:CCR4-NOT transcription complex subunit 1
MAKPAAVAAAPVASQAAAAVPAAAATAQATPAMTAARAAAAGGKVPAPGSTNLAAGGSEAELRAMVSKMFKEWIAICTGKASKEEGGMQTLQQQAMGYIHKLQHHGMLKAVPVMDKFFSLLMEMSLEYCVQDLEKQEKEAAEEGDEKKKKPGTSNSHFLTVDAYSDLIVLLIKCCGRGQQQPKQSEGKEDPLNNITAEVALLTKVVAVVSRVLMEDHDHQLKILVDAVPNGTPFSGFHQQPYFRFYSNLLIALNQSQGDSQNPSSNDILTVFSNTFHALSPLRLPGFAFSWLELISHRMFMPKLLLTKNQEGWPHFQRLLVIALQFLEPSLRNAQLPDAIRLFYKGTLKILLVLLHDFPEFLCSCHFSFCDVIPSSCIQMRNVILSSFPGHMRLPDPFTPNLKVDLLPEITQSPRILSKYSDHLKPSDKGPPPVSKEEIDHYLANRAPASWLQTLHTKLLLPTNASPANAGTRYNIPVISALVLYVGVSAIQRLQAASTENPQTTVSTLDTSAMDIYHELAVRLDSEGRYLFLNAVANHLRYPNNHTHYFSCVVLHLFADSRQHQEIIQEQITRILLERLIVNRPHPWGLLITFLELVKNPRYEFWKKMFIHCTPEIERLFDNVGQSCSGNLPKVRQHGVAGVAGAVAGAAGPAIPGSPPPAAATSAAQAAAAQGPLGVQPKSPVPKA